MAKQIFMAIVRGIFLAITCSIVVAFIYLVSIYLNPEHRAGLSEGLIFGTGIFLMTLLNASLEKKFFKKFWHGKFWLPFSVSLLVVLAWAVMTHPFLVKVPYYQQKHEGSALLSIVGMIGAIILLNIVQLHLSSWLRLRAEKRREDV